MSTDTSSKAALAARVQGPVYAPGDAGFAAEIAAFNTLVTHTPALVVAVTGASDVVEAVRFARAQRLRVSVQGAGHGGNRPISEGLLISTRRLDQLSLDPGTRIATIGAGVRWREVVAAAAKHGLAPITGSSATVGVTGYLLGGGLGPLARSHGFSSDYLVGMDVVTGTGELVEASDTANPELFWALRGGKIGLGVVTELRLRLVPLRMLYAGTLFFAEPDIEAALRAWIDWTANADARVTTSVAIVRFPPLEVIPAPLRGRRLLGLRFAIPADDDADAGPRLAAPLRAIAPVYLDGVGPLPAAEVARIHNDPSEPGPSWITGALLSPIDQAFATRLLAEVGAGTDPPFVAAEVRHLGSAVGGRAAAYTLALAANDPQRIASDVNAVADRVLTSLAAYLAPETNINFLPRPRSPEHLETAFPANGRARLAEARRRYDPDGLL